VHPQTKSRLRSCLENRPLGITNSGVTFSTLLQGNNIILNDGECVRLQAADEIDNEFVKEQGLIWVCRYIPRTYHT